MRRDKGFTLIELMVVIAILGILVATAFPTYRTFRRRAVGAEASTIMKQLLNAQVMYYLQNDHYFTGPPGGIAIFHDDPPNKPEIQQVKDALKITLPVGHFLDFLINDDGSGGVIIRIDANFPIFRDGSMGIHASLDPQGNVSYF